MTTKLVICTGAPNELPAITCNGLVVFDPRCVVEVVSALTTSTDRVCNEACGETLTKTCIVVSLILVVLSMMMSAAGASPGFWPL